MDKKNSRKVKKETSERELEKVTHSDVVFNESMIEKFIRCFGLSREDFRCAFGK